jgi:hypothetical protein
VSVRPDVTAKLKISLLAVAIVLAISSASGDAFACACCSDDGQRYVKTQAINAYAAGVLADIRFADAAHLYAGEADIESIKAVAAKSRDFQLAVSKSETSWAFEFVAAGGGGKLVFHMPENVTKFEIDPREPNTDTIRQGPLLYKEWRLTAKARGSGMFQGASGGGRQVTLILHGRGNSCTDAGQFNAWTLVLHGPKDTATFFGDLVAQ